MKIRKYSRNLTKQKKGIITDRRKIGIFLLIFLPRLIAGFLLPSVVRGHVAADTSGSRISDRQENAPLIATGEDSAPPASPEQAAISISAPQAILTFGPSYPEWDEGTTYTGGDQVVCGDKIYIAGWWTSGEFPGQVDVREAAPQTPPSTGSQVVPKAGASSPVKVVGYYPDWKPYQPQKLQMDVLTHIAYVFAISTPDSRLLPLENPGTTVRLVEDAHKNQAKVLLAVGGWSYNGAELEPVFVSVISTSERTRQLGDEILAMYNKYGFNGVDMDWEHLRVDGSSKDQYQELILYPADALHAQGKLLTSAVVSEVSADGSIYYDVTAHSSAVLNAVDWIHVMAYDGGDGERHSLYNFAINSAAYWCDTRKVPAGKVVLGVPFYGRLGWAGHGDILAANPDVGNEDHVMVSGTDVWYNSTSTIEKKAAYARNNLGGTMARELTQNTDDSGKSLLSAAGRGIQ